MIITNPQMATIYKTMTEQYPWAGSLGLHWPDGFDEHGHGTLDVHVYNDTDVLASFEVDTVGKVLAHA